MLMMIREGQDIHCGSTAIMYDGCTYEEVLEAKKTKSRVRTPRQHELVDWRKTTKNLSFGTNYGMGDKKLAIDLGVTRQEAKTVKRDYLDRFPQMRDWITEQHRLVRKELKVTTILGRPRRLWGALAGGGYLAEAERMAVNTRIQGSAADIVALAMIRCHQSKELRELEANMLLQIHDELIFEVPNYNIKHVPDIVERLMIEDGGLGLTVPMRADPGVGKDWNLAKD